MALPERLEFDLESAAAYLGCTTSDILYYLDKGLLRLAVSANPSFPEFFCVPFEKLSTEQQQTLQLLYNPDGIELQQVMLDLVPSSVRPYIAPYTAPLYLSQYQRNQIKYTRHELGEAIWILENFRGERLTVWMEGRLWGYWLKEENGWIADTCLAREELDKIKAEPEPELKPEPVSDDQPAYAAPPKKPNEASLLIVEYANKYYLEYKKHPKPSVFAKYLSAHASHEGFRIRTKEEMNRGQNAHEKRKYDFNGYGISERSLAKRLRDYRIKKQKCTNY